MSVNRSTGPAPWYTAFDLLTTANVKLGVDEHPGGFNLTSIRLATLDGGHVAFGTDTFADNPFSNHIDAFVGVDDLPAGQYALAVSGSGNSTNFFGDVSDFSVRLQVTPSLAATPVQDVTVDPVRNDFAEVFPGLTEQSVSVNRTSDQSSWYTKFDLLAPAKVNLGVLQHAGGFNLTSARLVTMDGEHVAFGTDTFADSDNPFSNPIDALVGVDFLPIGQYALEVSGSGNSTNFFGDVSDFSVRIQVLAVPEPETYALMLAGLGLVGFAARSRKNA